MYPTLYHFFHDVFGVRWDWLKPFNSYGLLVALAFVIGALVLKRQLKNKEEKGLMHPVKVMMENGAGASWVEITINSLIGFALGFKMVHALMNPYLFDHFDHYLTNSEGSLVAGILLAIVSGALTFYLGWRKKLPEIKTTEEDYYPHQHIGPIVFISVIFGMLGAKLFAWFEDPVPLIEFITDPFGGLSVLGGMVCAFLANLYYVHKHKLHKGHVMDAVAPGLILAYGVGRLGCHVSGDGDWGVINKSANPGFLPDWLWSYQYPNNVLGNSAAMETENTVQYIENCPYKEDYCFQLAEGVWPTPLYETLMCLVIFGVLIYMSKRLIIPGLLFSLYLVFSGIERLLIEFIRINDTYDVFGWQASQAQLISVGLILLGIGGFIFLKKNPKFFDPAENIQA